MESISNSDELTTGYPLNVSTDFTVLFGFG
jgi:hypothetical protein